MGQAVSRSARRSPHEVLGVEETASMDEIKRAYRRLAMEYHPDSPRARERGLSADAFIEISRAYETLCALHASPAAARRPAQVRKPEPEIDIQGCIERARRSSALSEGDYAEINNLFLEITRIEKITRGVTYNPPAFGYAKGNPKPFYSFYSTFSSLRHFNITPYTLSGYYDRLPRHAKREIDSEVRRVISNRRIDYSERVKELVNVIAKKDPRLFPAPKKILDLKISRPKITKQGVEITDSHQMTKEELEALRALSGALKNDHSMQRKPKPDPYASAKAQAVSDKDVFICEPCKKVFKSINQLTNHIQSKKHKEKLESMDSQQIQDLIAALEQCTIEGAVSPTDAAQAAILEEATEIAAQHAKAPHKKDKADRVSQPDRSKTDGNGSNEEARPPSPSEPKKSTPRTTRNKQGKPVIKSKKKPAPRTVPQEPDMRAGQSFALACAKCKAVFPTRNQLFLHLKESGHSAPL